MLDYETWSKLDIVGRKAFLDAQAVHLNSGFSLGSPTLTYSFLTDGDGRQNTDFQPLDGPYEFQPFSDFQESFVRFQLSYLESFLPISFVEVDGNLGQLGFGKYNLQNDGGFAQSPPHDDGKGAVFIDSVPAVNFASGKQGELGEKNFSTLTHEIGHALGLLHPLTYDGNIAHTNPISVDLDSGILSSMSYRSFYFGEFEEGGRPWGFKPLDIAAFKLIYGFKDSVEDNVFVLNTLTTSVPYKNGTTWDLSVAFPFLLVDTGGYDVVDLSKLTSGTVSDPLVFSFDTGLKVSRDAKGYIAGPTSFDALNSPELLLALEIYPDTIIEKLIGSAGVDIIAGNARGQEIEAGGGDDQLFGGGGNDTLDGGAGIDIARFELNESAYSLLNIGNGKISITNNSNGEIDILIGIEKLEYADKTVTLKEDDLPVLHVKVEGTELADIITRSLVNSEIIGKDGHDKLLVLSGTNIIDGGGDSDFIIGGFAADDLKGGAGNDVIRGDASGVLGGSDRISGGAGDDVLMGGQGADVFSFVVNDGKDVIGQFTTDNVSFNAATGYSTNVVGADFQSGVDHIELSSFTGVNSSNVMDFVSDLNGNAVFSEEGTEITFYNILENQLNASDFLFV